GLLKKPSDRDPDEAGRARRELPHTERALLERVPIELLVPIAIHPADGEGVARREEALIALGPRRSEEPFSQEDLDLLSAVADSLAMVLDRGTLMPGAARRAAPPGDAARDRAREAAGRATAVGGAPAADGTAAGDATA